MAESTTLTGGKAVQGESKVHVSNPNKYKVSEFSNIKFLNNLVGDYEFDRYGIYAIALLMVGCLGGIAVGTGSMVSPLEIAILIIPTMAALVMILAVAPMRALLWTCFASCIISTLMIAINLLV